ncbi:MAG: TIGR04283 family arsenosugar biosynthesis glycosyltransferase [Rhodospirillales bacterium]|nr:TIGR04283 family arsenosugar biosynthesis glycosyltransferase [Acetobacter sp.]
MMVPPVNRSLPGCRFSVIVPTLNEAALITDFLVHLREETPEAEIIVVDGGSHDQTAFLASQHATCVLQSPPGRAKQMNAGAAVASGEVLWFLHADSLVPPDPLGSIALALADPTVVGGCFRLKFPRRQWIYRISDRLGNLAVDLFQIALGDHGIFCRQSAFARMSGYPDVPLMEDAELYRRLRCDGGRVRQLPAYIVSSPRRYERSGPLRTTAFYFVILFLYLVKVHPSKLQMIYRKLFGNEDLASEPMPSRPSQKPLVLGATDLRAENLSDKPTN